MQQVKLGIDGPEVPALGIGTWAWGDNFFWSYGQEYGAKELEEAFTTAIDQGVNFFDTAEIYGLGESERLLGKFLSQTDKTVYIATKYFPLPWRWDIKSVAETLTASLERLILSQVTLYQVHWPFDFFMGQPTLMSALAQEVKQGRILTVGVSNYSAAQMKEAHRLLAEHGVHLAVNQVRYSLLSRQIESDGILATAKELGVTILAYSPLAQGLLTGKYSVENLESPTGARRLNPNFNRNGLEKISPVVNVLKQLSQKYQRTPAQISLNWLIAQEDVIPIPGAKNATQASQNAGALGWALNPEDVELLDQVSRPWLK